MRSLRHLGTALLAGALAGGLSAELHAQPMLCVELPPARSMETISVTMGLAVASRWDRGEWAYSDVEQEALLTALRHLRSVVPTPRPSRPPNTSMRFALLDSAALRFIPLTAMRYELTVHADGRVSDVRTMESSSDAVSDSTLANALMRGTRPTELAGVSRAFGADSVRLKLFTTAALAGAERLVTWIEVPFYERESPVFAGTQVSMIPPAAGPRYPVQQGRRERGKAHASFIVGADGVIERGSITISNASAPEFGSALRAWLPNVRFRPATIEGCPVRAAAGLPMEFSPKGRE